MIFQCIFRKITSYLTNLAYIIGNGRADETDDRQSQLTAAMKTY